MLRTQTVGRLETRGNAQMEWHVTGLFNDEQKEWERLNSPIFHAFGTTWHLRLSLNLPAGYIGLLLAKKKPRSLIRRLHYILSMKKKDGTIYKRLETTHDFMGIPVWGWKRFLKISTLLRDKNELTSNDELTIYLEMDTGIQCVVNLSCQTVSQEDTTYEEKERDSINDEPLDIQDTIYEEKERVFINDGPFDMQDIDVLRQNISEMFNDESTCDFTLKVRENEFKAHKFILRARSEVFASMFDSGMVESRNNTVNIDDCEPDGFRDFLQYLYTAKTDCLSPERMISLYCIADKYQVAELKKKCIQFLSNNITVDTFCDVISLALKYNERQLIRLSEEFFLSHALDILVSIKWQNFLKENMTVANELYIKHAKQFK